MAMSNVVAGTGHRPNNIWIGTKSAYEPEVRDRLLTLGISALEKWHPTLVLTGMALGWDQVLAEAAMAVGIPFTAYVPFPGQDLRWSLPERRHYHWILSEASDIVTVVPEPDRDVTTALMQRNEAMVDAADWVLALWNGIDKGGTARCVAYARDHQKPVQNLWNSWVKYCG